MTRPAALHVHGIIYTRIILPDEWKSGDTVPEDAVTLALQPHEWDDARLNVTAVEVEDVSE